MRIAVIGGGAGGLMAAAAAAKRGRGASVTVYERGARVGKKLLSTGNGRCNLTSANDLDDTAAFCAHYNDPALAAAVLRKADPRKLLRFFAEMGLSTRAFGEGVYPRSMQAASVLDVLRLYLKRQGVAERCGAEITELSPSREGFTLRAADGAIYSAEKVVAACGSPAAVEREPALFRALKRLGHTVLPFVPALTPLKCSHAFLKGLNGIRLDAAARLFAGEREIAAERGELLFKDYGVSGIVIFQLSFALACRLAQGVRERFTLSLDLFPEGDVLPALRAHRNAYGDEPAGELFTGILPRRVAENLLDELGVSRSAPISSLDLAAIAERARRVPLGEASLLPFSRAQVALGGVAAEEIDLDTMESRLIPGLYFAGEAANVAGRCGGYNLQWAWSSGYLAGSNVWSK